MKHLTSLTLLLVLVAVACVKDDLWRKHYSKTYAAGNDITVSADSMATVSAPSGSRARDEADMTPLPGYLTVVSSHYYTNERGDILYKERAGIEAMHNVRVNVRVVEGNPAAIESLACTIGGLASRFDVARSLLLGPAARVTGNVAMHDHTGTALFRLLGAAADRQPLTLSLVQTDGQQQQVEVDVTPVLHDLRPTPFRPNTSNDTDAHVEVETTVNIDIEFRLPDPADTEATVTAALAGWRVNEEDVNAY